MHSDCAVEEELPIVPNYLLNPVFPSSTQLPCDVTMPHDDTCSPQSLPVVELTSPRCSDGQDSMTVSTFTTDSPSCHTVAHPACLVVKVRCADCAERDFVEVDVHERSYQALLQACCSELEVKPEAVSKIRKLPNVLVRKDKDIARLKDGQELEIVMCA